MFSQAEHHWFDLHAKNLVLKYNFDKIFPLQNFTLFPVLPFKKLWLKNTIMSEKHNYVALHLHFLSLCRY